MPLRFFRYQTGHIFIPGCGLYPITEIEIPDFYDIFDAKFINRPAQNIWMEKYLEEYLDGPRCWWCCGPSLCRAWGNLHQYWWTRLWAPACWLPNSVWLVWFNLMFLFVSCFRTNVPKCEKETTQQGNLQWLTYELCFCILKFLSFHFQ